MLLVVEELAKPLRVRVIWRSLLRLARYYGIRTMRIVPNDRRVGRNARGCYAENTAYFTRKGLNKRFILHEFYHHLVEAKGLDVSRRVEEKDARNYARRFLRKRYS